MKVSITGQTGEDGYVLSCISDLKHPILVNHPGVIFYHDMSSLQFSDQECDCNLKDLVLDTGEHAPTFNRRMVCFKWTRKLRFKKSICFFHIISTVLAVTCKTHILYSARFCWKTQVTIPDTTSLYFFFTVSDVSSWLRAFFSTDKKKNIAHFTKSSTVLPIFCQFLQHTAKLEVGTSKICNSHPI